MGLQISGYVVEPPRVGQANSPFTLTPNVFISDQGAFDAAYPTDESAPRTEYAVFVLEDGDLASASFAWTKNEGAAVNGQLVAFQRFDYEGRSQVFKPLPGGLPTLVGTLLPDSNSSRLKVAAPALTDLVAFPIRVSVGLTGSGVSFSTTLVEEDADFSEPAAGTVQISRATGNLNWAPADLATYSGQTVRFQRQSFFSFRESNGLLGLSSDVLLLTPIPASGQHPLIRIGFGAYLEPIERDTEALFSADPVVGTVEWARATGALKFSSADIEVERPIYYDGVVFSRDTQIQSFTVGTVTTPGTLNPLPPEEGDIFFRVGSVQLPETEFVDSFDTVGKRGVVQIRRSDGQVRFSVADQALYGAQGATAYVADLAIERGLSLRLFRTPVDLSAEDPTLKDVSAFHTTEGATLANPVIQAPSVLLPATPMDSLPLTVSVEQGTGSYVGSLERLDVASPPVGLGYVIDFDLRELQFAQRKQNVVVTPPGEYGAVQLPDPLIIDSGLVLEKEVSPGAGVFSPLVIGETALIDRASGVVSLTTTAGAVVMEGSGASIASAILTDAGADFVANGVQPEDLVVVLTGDAAGVYTVIEVSSDSLVLDVSAPTPASDLLYEIRRGKEILADRFFSEVPPIDPGTKVERVLLLGAAANSPRLRIDPSKSNVSRFRFGSDTFVTTEVVPDDASFSAIPDGVVQVSASSGNLNFSPGDLGSEVYWARELALGSEFKLQPALGFFEFSERMLEGEEALLTYTTSEGEVVEERAAFLVRKELVQDHPVATTELSFNPSGREVAGSPPPRVFRGGRPQSSAQVSFDLSASLVRFSPTRAGTDALPSGAVQPEENVYIDYYVYAALGGEKTVSATRPPLQSAQVTIEEGSSEFTVAGDRTNTFAASRVLRVDSQDVYLIEAATYDGSTDTTTVSLVAPQSFKNDARNPRLAVSSGAIRSSAAVGAPSYFTVELAEFDAVPRGSNKVRIAGNVERQYPSGTLVVFEGMGALEVGLVSGSAYNPDSDRTEVVLTANVLRQYSAAATVLKRSVRPILEAAQGVVFARGAPQSSPTVFRRVEGNVGRVLTTPEQYTIDESGRVTFAEPLAIDEELSILYTGATIVPAGTAIRASYTALAVPDSTNGLLGQVLRMDYTAYVPDSFFWRVEPITNFRGELAQQYADEARSSVPTSGPILENASGPILYKQGRESVFFEEGRLSNEDLVARATLKYFNDVVNLLEDVLQKIDGRVVGDHDGRFQFDGNIGNPDRATFSEVTNQIDDRFKISDAPYTISGPPFAVTSIGTYQEVYRASPSSRFFPTKKRCFGVTVPPAGLQTGDAILDLGVKNIVRVESVQRRAPWAVSTRVALPGETTIQVDQAQGSVDLIRPGLDVVPGLQVAIVAQDGTVLVSDASAITVQSTTPTSVTFTTGVPVQIPVGSTVRMATTDTAYRRVYRVGIDVGVDNELGLLTHIEPYPPLDGSVPGIPEELEIRNPAGGEALDVVVALNNVATAPERFPALDGLTTDDDGDRQFPILSPDASSEDGLGVGHLPQELSLIGNLGGSVRAITVAPEVLVGSLDAARLIITNDAGAWPSPSPQVHDLVEIRTGLNANSTYRRITSVGVDTITVASPFASQDVGFEFVVSAADNLTSGVNSGTLNTVTRLTDVTADFVSSGVAPGHTLIVTSGVFTGLRRQVIRVVSATQLDVVSFPGTATNFSYRISNSLVTYGGPNSLRDTTWLPALSGELTSLSQITSTLDQFFSAALTDVAVGIAGESLGDTFTDTNASFGGVRVSDLLWVQSAANEGFYRILSVSETSLQIEGTFPVNAVGQSYKVASSVGVSLDALRGVLRIRQEAASFMTPTAAFQAIVTAVPVVGDASALATRLVDLDARLSQVVARMAQLSDPGGAVSILEDILTSGDRLFDKRYVWLNARMNLETGILTKRARAISNRIKAQQETLDQLTKLLSTTA